MSDEWLFYPCPMGEQQASIFFDHGIRETIDQIAPPQFLKVRVTFKHPRPDGLSSREEYQQLCDLEDELQQVVAQHGGLYVGRVTVGGHRYLHCFTAGSEADWAARLQPVGDRHAYELRFALKPDPKREGYWQDLFPTDDDLQVIQDLRVLQSVEEHGDDGTASRHIEHWAHFPTQEIAEQFAHWAQARRYGLDTIDTTDDGKHRVRFAHDGTLRLAEITSHTIALRRKASELGGEYDGWETPVCKNPG